VKISLHDGRHPWMNFERIAEVSSPAEGVALHTQQGFFGEATGVHLAVLDELGLASNRGCPRRGGTSAAVSSTPSAAFSTAAVVSASAVLAVAVVPPVATAAKLVPPRFHGPISGPGAAAAAAPAPLVPAAVGPAIS
jgi:hypothetical protein